MLTMATVLRLSVVSCGLSMYIPVVPLLLGLLGQHHPLILAVLVSVYAHMQRAT